MYILTENKNKRLDKFDFEIKMIIFIIHLLIENIFDQLDN